ncbi:MAG: hypothetical protein ACYCS9_05835 [Candidatus Dormibacteria bacterium]
MTDLERLRALKAKLAAAPGESWVTTPDRMPWHLRPGQDPRPDLPGSELWSRLLLLASGDADDPSGLYGRLLAARACGAVLEQRGNRWKLAPTIDPTEQVSVWQDQAAWDADAAKWLRPRSRGITRRLLALGEEQ